VSEYYDQQKASFDRAQREYENAEPPMDCEEEDEEVEMTVPTLSTGQKSTVGVWIGLASAVFGPESKQVEFLKSKATKEHSLEEPVLADERQLLLVLMSMSKEEST
jgi:hypothetical protein